MAYDYDRNVRSKASSAEIDLGLKAYMNKVYSFMAVGLALTGVIAHITSKMAFDFSTNTMTSLGEILDRQIDRNEFVEIYKRTFFPQ